MKKLFCLLFFSLSFFAESQESKQDSIYNFEDVDVKPNFSGEIVNFYKFLAKNYLVPEKLKTKVKVQTEFIIEKDGSLTNIKITEDPGYGTGDEAKKVLKKSPKWNPGKKDGLAVRTRYKLPINLQGVD